jgi:hypothetical protein
VGKRARWLLSGFVVGLTPGFINGLIVAFTPVTLGLSSMIGRGELLMLSVGLSAGALADIVDSFRRVRDRAVLFCLACVMAALTAYTVVVVVLAFDVPLYEPAVAVVSLLIYIPSLYVSAKGVATVERRS